MFGRYFAGSIGLIILGESESELGLQRSQAMGSKDDVSNFENAVVLSTLALEATVKWDDVTDHFSDHPEALTDLDFTQEELDQVSHVVRKVMDRAHSHKNNLKRVFFTSFRSNAHAWSWPRSESHGMGHDVGSLAYSSSPSTKHA